MNFKKKKAKSTWVYPLVATILIVATFTWSDFIISKTTKVLLPIKLKVSQTTDNVQNFVKTFSDTLNIEKENKKLKYELVKLKYLSTINTNLESENKELRRLLHLKDSTKDELIAAQIIYIDSLNPYEVITIDKGSRDMIEKNMEVISDLGLVGRVKEVFYDHSTVELITSTKSFTSAIDKKHNSLSILSGQGNDILNLEYVVINSEIAVGDEIYTSGISDIYTRNILLGNVASVDSSDIMYKTVTVKLPYKIFNLKNVMIIKTNKENNL